jgi:hypothetical protein
MKHKFLYFDFVVCCFYKWTCAFVPNASLYVRNANAFIVLLETIVKKIE